MTMWTNKRRDVPRISTRPLSLRGKSIVGTLEDPDEGYGPIFNGSSGVSRNRTTYTIICFYESNTLKGKIFYYGHE